MRSSVGAYLTYAINQDGKLVHVDNVPNGNECGCICPHCQSKLCAKNGGDGEKMIHHFAHLSGSDCVGAVETVQHMMAKAILKETKKVKLPKRLDGRREESLCFDKVEVEFYDKDTKLRPDCIGYYDDKCLWIEFKRTHAVDTKKIGKIISAHIDCIEIDLSGCTTDPSFIKEFILNSSKNRRWIRNMSFGGNIRIAGRSIDEAYCNRYDYDEYKRKITRIHAKDENGQLVSLFDDNFDMNKHTYYCVACSNEVTVDIDKLGVCYFSHIDDNINCKDDPYLREATKEILYDKFCRSKEFIIQIPQNKDCIEMLSCKIYDKNSCYKQEYFEYDLKERGYIECLKEYCLPDSDFQYDLVIKRADSFDNAIGIIVNSMDYHANKPQTKQRIIEIEVYDESDLDTLKDKPISSDFAKFWNFRNKNKGTATVAEIKRFVKKFELFASGKYYLNTIPCKQAINKGNHHSTIYELLLNNNMGKEASRLYALLQCYKANKIACYCELCFFLANNEYNELQRICKRYKTKGTPRMPLFHTFPVNCPFFLLNKKLVYIISEQCKDLKLIEKEI